jgi:hypothetical protein
MIILDLRDSGVVQVRRTHTQLRGKKPFARGSRAALFEGRTPERVLKLTVDAPSYLYLTDGYAPTGGHVPVVFEDFGQVGQTWNDEALYLVELERLQPRPKGYALSRVLRKAYELAEERFQKNGYRDPACLPDTDDQPSWLPDSLAEYFTQLNLFASNTESLIDLSWRSNYMVRPNGELVGSDPLFDPEAGSRKKQSQRAAYPPAYCAAQQGGWPMALAA